jgi:TatD DNase family protein
MTADDIRGVDFHCHLDLYPDFPANIQECERAGIATLAVTTTPKAYLRNEEMTRSTKHVRAALGMHPQLVAQRADELTLFEELLPRTRYVGEVGLDAGRQHYGSFKQQTAVFTAILQLCARAGGKILSVHSIRSAGQVLNLIEEHLPAERGTVVLHWFSGSASELRRAIELGCYFSVNAGMLKTAAVQSIISVIPLNRLLTETDGPFVQIDGRAARPEDTVSLTGTLAVMLRHKPEALRARLVSNLKHLLEPGEAKSRY